MKNSKTGHEIIIKVVSLLIDNGADVNAETKYGVTPLDYAKENGHTDTIKLLKRNSLNSRN